MKSSYIIALLLAFSVAATSCDSDPKAPSKTPSTPEQPEQPNDPVDVEFVASYSSGAYYGDDYSPGVDCYFISLSDNGFDANGGAKPNTTYYRLDLYAPMYEGAWCEYMSLPEGEYHLDKENSYAAWTFAAESSSYVKTGESEVEKQLPFEEGVLVVTAELTTLTAVIEGKRHVVTFTGDHLIANTLARPMESMELSVAHAYAKYYGDKFAPNKVDNFYLYLSDKGLDEYGFEQPGGAYYCFDIYIGVESVDDSLALPHGTYEWDAHDTLASGTISAYYTKYYLISDDGMGYTDARFIDRATLTVDQSGITAEVYFGEAKHLIRYDGAATIYDLRQPE